MSNKRKIPVWGENPDAIPNPIVPVEWDTSIDHPNKAPRLPGNARYDWDMVDRAYQSRVRELYGEVERPDDLVVTPEMAEGFRFANRQYANGKFATDMVNDEIRDYLYRHDNYRWKYNQKHEELKRLVRDQNMEMKEMFDLETELRELSAFWKEALGVRTAHWWEVDPEKYDRYITLRARYQKAFKVKDVEDLKNVPIHRRYSQSLDRSKAFTKGKIRGEDPMDLKRKDQPEWNVKKWLRNYDRMPGEIKNEISSFL